MKRLPPYPGYENTEECWRRRMVEGIERIADRLGWIIVAVVLIAGCVGWILLQGGKW